MSHALRSQVFPANAMPALAAQLYEVFIAAPLLIVATALSEALRLARTREY